MTQQNLFIEIPEKKGQRKLAYTQWGNPENNKVLVCVHGLSRNGRDFDYLARAMADDYRVIAIDVAGRGQSDWLDDKSKYNYQTYVADILALLNSLGIKKVDWVGTSMGGIIAMLIASMQPGLINKMVLNDLGYIINGAALERIFTYVGNAPLFDTRQEAEAAIRKRMGTFGINTEEQWAHITANSVEAVGDKYRFAYDPALIKKPSVFFKIASNIKHPSKWLKMPDADLSIFWNKVTCPVLLLRGELSDILSAEVAFKMRDEHANVELVEIKNVGHAPMLMDDGQIKIVKDWLLKS